MLEGIDNAHREVWKVLVPVLEEGVLIDGIGRIVRFKSSIVIMTTMIGFAESVTKLEDVNPSAGSATCRFLNRESRHALEHVFPPEVLQVVQAIILLQ